MPLAPFRFSMSPFADTPPRCLFRYAFAADTLPLRYAAFTAYRRPLVCHAITFSAAAFLPLLDYHSADYRVPYMKEDFAASTLPIAAAVIRCRYAMIMPLPRPLFHFTPRDA